MQLSVMRTSCWLFCLSSSHRVLIKNYFMNSLLESNVIFRTLCLFAKVSFSGIAVFARLLWYNNVQEFGLTMFLCSRICSMLFCESLLKEFAVYVSLWKFATNEVKRVGGSKFQLWLIFHETISSHFIRRFAIGIWWRGLWHIIW